MNYYKKILTIFFIVSFTLGYVKAGVPQTDDGTKDIVPEKKEEATPDRDDDVFDKRDEDAPPVKKKKTIKKKKSLAAKKGKKKTSNKKPDAGKKTAPKEDLITIDDSEKTVPKTHKSEDSLLIINEGTFKYNRIPEIKLPKESVPISKDGSTDDKLVKKDPNQIPEKPEKVSDSLLSEDKGLFGMNKKTADYFAKGILLVIIILIIGLYRFNSKNRRGRVVRRYTK